jgi:hypothetical protein
MSFSFEWSLDAYELGELYCTVNCEIDRDDGPQVVSVILRNPLSSERCETRRIPDWMHGKDVIDMIDADALKDMHNRAREALEESFE